MVREKASGWLAIGDRKEIDKATWRKPRGIRLTLTSRIFATNCSPRVSNTTASVNPTLSRVAENLDRILFAPSVG